MVDNLNITSKTIQVGEDIEFPSYETRYFAESITEEILNK